MESIKKLQELMKMQLCQNTNKLDSEGNIISVKNQLNMPAESRELELIQNKLQLQIPDQYREFLINYNGAMLFNYDNIDGLNLLSIQDVLKYTLYAKNTFEEDWINNIIVFAKIIGEDNYLGFKVINDNTYQIVDCYFEQLPKEWREINLSFDEFLVSFILKQGKKFWIN